MLEKLKSVTGDKTLWCLWEKKISTLKENERVTWKKRNRESWEGPWVWISSRKQQWWQQACNNGSHLHPCNWCRKYKNNTNQIKIAKKTKTLAKFPLLW